MSWIKNSLIRTGWILCSLSLMGCSNAFFQPLKQHIATPEQYGIEYKDVYFSAEDGARLHGWWFPAREQAKACVLFLHGNAENISTHAGMAYWLTQFDYDVFIFDYRGYGRSAGKVDIAGAISDIQAAKDHAKQSFARQQKLFVVAHSLGASLGITSLAGDASGVEGAIFISPFSEYPRVAREMVSKTWLGWLFQWPVSLTISGRYNPVDYVARLDGLPTVFMYSPGDEIIAPAHVGALYQHATGDKHLEQLSGGHNQLFSVQENQRLILGYLDSWSASVSAQ